MIKENIIIRKFFQDMTTFRYKLLVVCSVSVLASKIQIQGDVRQLAQFHRHCREGQ